MNDVTVEEARRILEAATARRDAFIRQQRQAGATLELLAREYGLSRQRIQQICDLSKDAPRLVLHRDVDPSSQCGGQVASGRELFGTDHWCVYCGAKWSNDLSKDGGA